MAAQSNSSIERYIKAAFEKGFEQYFDPKTNTFIFYEQENQKHTDNIHEAKIRLETKQNDIVIVHEYAKILDIDNATTMTIKNFTDMLELYKKWFISMNGKRNSELVSLIEYLKKQC
jgi:hypothetical protein